MSSDKASFQEGYITDEGCFAHIKINPLHSWLDERMFGWTDREIIYLKKYLILKFYPLLIHIWTDGSGVKLSSLNFLLISRMFQLSLGTACSD